MISTFNTDHSFTTDISNDFEFSLVPTAMVLQTLSCLRAWLIEGNEQHFLLVGEHGSAKRLVVHFNLKHSILTLFRSRLILDYLIKERTDVDLATVYCSSNVTPDYVISKINQVKALFVHTDHS